jgi:E3 ubiquitin-protein ligase MYCBP2
MAPVCFQTISDLMMLLPSGSSLQQIAIRCWAIKFRPTDHQFLHRSHLFSTISKILCRSDEQEGGAIVPSALTNHGPPSLIEAVSDITPSTEIRVSSRQAMVASLNDYSTETFWESGDEDRNRGKWISLSLPLNVAEADLAFGSVSIHVDNGRDLGNKVSSVTFKAGKTMDDAILVKQCDVESRFCGWVTCFLSGDLAVSLVKIELKGPDNSLRVRQVRALGIPRAGCCSAGATPSPPHPLPALLAESSAVLQQNCETETLRVFRLITAQVFGRLLEDPSTATGENGYPRYENEEDHMQESYLKEHVVGILFSRSKLSHLQRQVCTHIVQAIEKEAARFRDDWEMSLCSGSPSSAPDESASPARADNYCFEMLSLVLALSGSPVGRSHLAGQVGLLRDLLTLLHTGTGRVQRQVIALLRRVLPKIPPATLAEVMGVAELPPRNFGALAAAAAKDKERPQAANVVAGMGILDVFLACIAKALTLQVKTKGAKGAGKSVSTVSLASSIHPRASDNVGDRWWLRGAASRRVAEEVISLLKSMGSGAMGDEWTGVSKSAVAECVVNLTRLDEGRRDPAECLRHPPVWLALASLCVIDRDHVEGLSTSHVGGAEGAAPRPTCDNHDGEQLLLFISYH